MIRVFAVIFAVLAAIASGWLGYRLSSVKNPVLSSSVRAPNAEPEQNDSVTPEKALLHLLGTNFSDLSGRPQSVKQWSGKVVVVNFWATWCPPCREEMPGFSRVQKKLAAKGVQFIGIGIDDADKIQQFQKDFPVSYPLLVAGLETMGLTRELGNATEGLPFTVFIDRQGQLRLTKAGRLDEAEVERRLRELL
jgi:thiol-disulfide isomerase/thioredoxin